MNDKRLIVGILLFLIGGGLLAFGDGVATASVGTTVALAGIVMMGWAWLSRSESGE